jgi:hypothetical protein
MWGATNSRTKKCQLNSKNRKTLKSAILQHQQPKRSQSIDWFGIPKQFKIF